MKKGKMQFISEKYQVAVKIISDSLECSEQDAIENCIRGALLTVAYSMPDSLTAVVIESLDHERLVVGAIALFCHTFGPKIMVGVEADGLQRPTLIGDGVRMEMLPLTGDQVGELVIELGSLGYEIQGKMGNYYIYEKARGE
jgi:hypothetical protein